MQADCHLMSRMRDIQGSPALNEERYYEPLQYEIMKRNLLVPTGLVILPVVFGLTACAPSGESEQPEPEEVEMAAANTLTAAEEADGWRLLFDGSSFEGWRGLGLDTLPTDLWTIDEGAVRKLPSGEVPVQADGQPIAGNDLITVETFEDFEFAFEFRLVEGANSGVKYNVDEQMSVDFPPSNAALGFEYQVLDPAHPDAEERYPLRIAGALYDMIGHEKDVLKPAGEWNAGRIVFVGNHGEHWLNGERLLAYDLDSAEFAEALAASKYAVNEGFADRRVGHIVLQDHLDEVWYRNLKIKLVE